MYICKPFHIYGNSRSESGAELQLEGGAEFGSGAEQSSNLEVGWDLEQQKCEMGHPLTQRGNPKSISKKYIMEGISPGRGEIQREKSKDSFCQ